MDILILVCVGASEYKFDRLLKMIDELCDSKVIDGKKVVAQIGYTDYVPRNYKSFSLIGRDEFEKYLQDSTIVISHAGTGSVIPAIKLGKKVIVVPRLEEYGEHLDNHQLELRDIFTKEGYALSANNKEELSICIKNMETFSPKKFVSNNKIINQLLIEFIDKM